MVAKVKPATKEQKERLALLVPPMKMVKDTSVPGAYVSETCWEEYTEEKRLAWLAWCRQNKLK